MFYKLAIDTTGKSVAELLRTATVCLFCHVSAFCNHQWLCYYAHVCVLFQDNPRKPRLELLPLQERQDALQALSDSAAMMLADFCVPAASGDADKKQRELCAIDGGSGSGKTRLGYEFFRWVPQRLPSLGNSLYLFVNLGNGSSPLPEQLQWGMSVYLGLRVALQMLLPPSRDITTELVSQILHAIDLDTSLVQSFSLRSVLLDYSEVVQAANANGAALPLHILAHVDEAQFMLNMTTWHPREPQTELAARSMCRVLMDASMNRQVFFFPYLSGTYPMMSLKLFDPTEYVVNSVTCGQLSPEGSSS